MPLGKGPVIKKAAMMPEAILQQVVDTYSLGSVAPKEWIADAAPLWMNAGSAVNYVGSTSSTTSYNASALTAGLGRNG